jgi:thiol-disulfide isomerase/thioredoxin
MLSCRYVSTLTHSQSVIAKEGIFGGPGQTEKYAQKVGRPSFLTSPDCQPILPPEEIGNTMETMLKKGVVFSENQRKKLYQKSDSVRGWSLADFWEQTSWPRDASGGGSVRFGLPVVEERDLDNELMISGAPLKKLDRQYLQSASPQDADRLPRKPVKENPYVQPIADVSGMQSDIEEAGVDCILFLSAKFCKTCKSIDSKFTRMARKAQDTSPIVFAKAEVSGRSGKELGKILEVDAVPAFILFREGKRFGTPLSTSKLPSNKLDMALSLLESGSEWDPSILKEES